MNDPAVGYFTIRVRSVAADGGRPRLSGLIERLETGEKLEFRSGPDLVRLLEAWSRSDSKMFPWTPAGNDGDPKRGGNDGDPKRGGNDGDPKRRERAGS